MSKCEHGLTSKECYVCASPKWGKHAEPAAFPGGPRMGSALQKLGARLADMLDDDQWNNIEPMLLDVHAEAAHPAVQSEPAQQKQPRIPTSCGYCTFEEADGELIEQCPRCKAADAQQAAPPADDEALQVLQAIGIALRMGHSPSEILDENSPIREAIDSYLAKVTK